MEEKELEFEAIELYENEAENACNNCTNRWGNGRKRLAVYCKDIPPN